MQGFPTIGTRKRNYESTAVGAFTLGMERYTTNLQQGGGIPDKPDIKPALVSYCGRSIYGENEEINK